MKPIGWIYLTTNLVNEKIYIGKHEISENKGLNAFYIGSGTFFKLALEKYGKENFKRKILKLCFTEHELTIWEHVYIKKYRSQDKNIGYNIADGDVNTSGYNPAKLPEVRDKIKNKIRERGGMKEEKNPNYGNYWTDEQKEALSKKMVGRYDGKKNPNYGNKWSKEKKNQLSKKLHERTQSDGYVNPMQDKVRITDGSVNTIISKDTPLPEGYWYGMTRGVRKKKKYEN